MIKIIKNEIILILSFLFLIILLAIEPNNFFHLYSYVNWSTIITLTILLIITTAIKESGYLNIFALNMIKTVKNERNLAFRLVFLSLLLSTFLTNDITLFIVIPITLSLQNYIENDLKKLIIFEAIAVNVGSALTPIGNPQNIFLWHKWNVNFFYFVFKLLPLVLFLSIILFIFIFIFFNKREIAFIPEKQATLKKDKILYNISFIMFFLFIVFLELKIELYFLVFTFLVYFIIKKVVFKKVDWLLILLFIVFFLDFNILAKFDFIKNIMYHIPLKKYNNVMLFSALFSQIMSNVPAAIFVAKFSHLWLPIIYGVNIGGNGLIVGSLANLIAIRLAKSNKLWLKFHLYSIPYFIITLIIFYVIYSKISVPLS